MMIVKKLPALMPGTTAVTMVKVKNLPNIVTGRNEVVAKVMFLQLCVILFTQCMLGYHPSRRPPKKETPQEGGAPQADPQEGDPPRRRPPRRNPLPGPPPRGKLRGIRSRPTPKGEIEGDQIQAHTQGGN